ncbi:MAG TPA: 4-hydroxy-tetrahydrodipicolinate reductase [Bacteroidia bacterium]|jgi:4-hydroxy-tetrahydrodipicolinate reductase|nr:4-hydroxy-tetrahydrodipicolinate reductase [Bacteroidia bacterium]
MKIALIGYGKMGKEIEKIALSQSHEVVWKFDETNAAEFTAQNLKKADVAIEFTTPDSAVSNIYKCFEANVPVVCGTTGWLKHFDEVKQACNDKKQAFFYASNYSIGVNLFFKLNEQLATIMKPYKNYTPSMEEIHHIHKKDAPSGTGITLAEGLIKKHGGISKWALAEQAKTGELPILAKREGEVPGTHIVSYTSDYDKISIRHEAYSRKGFAEGAVVAALWLVGKKGVYGMNDLLGFEK